MNKINNQIETPEDEAQREKDEYQRDTEREEIEIDQPEYCKISEERLRQEILI